MRVYSFIIQSLIHSLNDDVREPMSTKVIKVSKFGTHKILGEYLDKNDIFVFSWRDKINRFYDRFVCIYDVWRP